MLSAAFEKKMDKLQKIPKTHNLTAFLGGGDTETEGGADGGRGTCKCFCSTKKEKQTRAERHKRYLLD
jgi:hypothetical protein